MKKSTQGILIVLCIMCMYTFGNAQFTAFNLENFNMSFDNGDKPPRTTSGQPGTTSGGSGDAIVDIQLDLPSSGYVLQDKINVKWSHSSLKPPYTLTVGTEGGSDVMKATVNTVEYVLDLTALDLNADDHYYISIEKKMGGKLHQSKRANFDIPSQENIKVILESLDGMEEFKMASPFKQEMMKAYLLSENKYYLKATDIYMNSIKNESSSRNTLRAINLLLEMKKKNF